MKIKIKKNSLTLEEVKQTLEKEFGNRYKIGNYSKYSISIAKSKLIGATVMVQKNKILVNGNFPSMMAMMGFMAIVVLLGFIIPLVIYLLVFHKKMKAVEKEVGEFIKKEYSDILEN